MNPERGREAMKVIDIVGEQVGPFDAPPFPDRLIDVNRASARQRARAVVGAPVHGVGTPARMRRETSASPLAIARSLQPIRLTPVISHCSTGQARCVELAPAPARWRA